MNYIDRTKLELQNITITDDELIIRLQESDISDPTLSYNSQSNTDKKAIYSTVLSILESIANDPQQMRSIREEDQSISDVSVNLTKRIDQINSKIRMMNVSSDDDSSNNSSFFSLFRD